MKKKRDMTIFDVRNKLLLSMTFFVVAYHKWTLDIYPSQATYRSYVNIKDSDQIHVGSQNTRRSRNKTLLALVPLDIPKLRLKPRLVIKVFSCHPSNLP